MIMKYIQFIMYLISFIFNSMHQGIAKTIYRIISVDKLRSNFNAPYPTCSFPLRFIPTVY